MEGILHETVKGKKFELLIDTKIFSKDIVLKAAYNFLDRGYFFFKIDEKENVILQFTKKEDVEEKPEKIIWDFSDCLLETCLRDKLEKDNKVIRETIVTKAIRGPLDIQNFVTLDTDKMPQSNQEQNTVDFDKDIDQILKEIENDPELKIDEAEIEKILAEIEAENKTEEKPMVSLNTNAIQDAKKKFKN